MTIEHFIFTKIMLFIILEYMYTASKIINTDMNIILSVTYIYISYSSKGHQVFNTAVNLLHAVNRVNHRSLIIVSVK